MTIEEFCKKHCYNGHDPNNCHMKEDLMQLIRDNSYGDPIIRSEFPMTEEKYQELKKAWEERHRGMNYARNIKIKEDDEQKV